MNGILFTFNSNPQQGDAFLFEDPSNQSFLLTYENLRQASGEITLGADIDASMQFFIQAFNSDFNASGIYTLAPDYTAKTITLTKPSEPNINWVIGLDQTEGRVPMVSDAGTPQDPELSIISVEILEAASNPCSTVLLRVTTSTQADEVYSPISQAVATNPFDITVNRQNAIPLGVRLFGVNDPDQQATRTLFLPPLSEANFSVEVDQTPSGAVATVVSELSSPIQFELEYSLNLAPFTSSNTFSGLGAGNYSIRVKDNIGCLVTLEFTVEEFVEPENALEPLAEISNANSFRFVKETNWDSCSTPRNTQNTLSYQERAKLNNRAFKQLFQQCDVIRTQIKTSYKSVVAHLVDCQGQEVEYAVSQVTENTNVKDARDGYLNEYVIEGEYQGKVALTFPSGNLYNPENTSEVTGTYNLGSGLMSWIDSVDYISLDALGWFRVLERTTLADGQECIIIDLNATQITFNDGDQIITTSIYNLLEFERWEFSLDMGALSGDYYLRVVTSDVDPSFETQTFISEWFNVAEEQAEPHHIIEYYSTKANEINYSTGIVNKIRVPYLKDIKWSPNEENELYVTDTKTVSLDNKVREFYKMTLAPLPTAIAQKIILALAHNKLRIDGVNYLREGETEVSQLGTTNLYQLNVNLVRSEYVFDNNRAQQDPSLPVGTPLQVDDNASGLLFVE